MADKVYEADPRILDIVLTEWMSRYKGVTFVDPDERFVLLNVNLPAGYRFELAGVDMIVRSKEELSSAPVVVQVDK